MLVDQIPEALKPGELEVVAQRLDADGEIIDRALLIVRDFISERQLVLYGGLGLDYSLKARPPGQGIYPPGERPDYDVLSPRSVGDAYDLATILHEAGFPAVDAIRALHVQTMRVRINFVPVADISFVPETVYKILPTLSLDPDPQTSGASIRVIHPFWQRMDQHAAFCSPFRDPPHEPVFHRFRKDLKRFNLLAEAYPLPQASNDPERSTDERGEMRIPFLMNKTVIHGVPALVVSQIFLSEAAGIANSDRSEGPKDGPAGRKMRVEEPDESGVSSLVLEGNLPSEIGHMVGLATTSDPEEVLSELGYEEVQRFRPVLDLLPMTITAKCKDPGKGYVETLVLYVHQAQIIPVSTSAGGLAGVKVISLQYLLVTFLLGYHVNGAAGLPTALRGPPAPTYLKLYHEALRTLNRGAQVMDKMAAKFKTESDRAGDWPLIPNATPFSLSTQMFGDLNMGLSQMMSISSDASSIKQLPGDPEIRKLIPTPQEMRELPMRKWAPGRGDPPSFDYAASPWFRLDGGPMGEQIL